MLKGLMLGVGMGELLITTVCVTGLLSVIQQTQKRVF